MKRLRDEKGVFLPSHGQSDTRLYNTWCAMKERCNNPHNKSYRRYGARGIKVCQAWSDSFQSFRDWAIEAGYEESLTIDRINNEQGYSPENCRWVTTKEQNRNYSRNHMITYRGKTKCVAEWAEETGIKAATILFRLKAGKELEQVFDAIDGRTTRWKKAYL